MHQWSDSDIKCGGLCVAAQDNNEQGRINTIPTSGPSILTQGKLYMDGKVIGWFETINIDMATGDTYVNGFERLSLMREITISINPAPPIHSWRFNTGLANKKHIPGMTNRLARGRKTAR